MCLIYHLFIKDVCARLLRDESRLLNSRYSTCAIYICVCVCVCVCVWIYTYIYIDIHTHTHTYPHTSIYSIYTHIQPHTHRHLCICVYKSRITHDKLLTVIIPLEHHCPTELSAMMEMSYICVVQYGSHWLQMDIEHLKCG